jgi:hypothetical protein
VLTFWNHLWKEWRDHRRTVVAFWILLLVGTAVLSFVIPEAYLASGALSSVVLSGSMMLAVVAVCTELIPGEAKRNTIAFLARTPHGLQTAFWAKATVVVLSIGVFAGSAWIVSSLFRVAALPPEIHEHLTVLSSGMTHFAVGLLVCAMWSLAISCWTPSGLLAIPAVGFLAFPYYLWVREDPHMLKVFPWQSHVYLQVVAAVVVAWGSFVWGRRFGRSGLAATWRGITLTAAGSLPFWTCLVVWHADFHSVDPQKSMRIRNGYLGSGGRLAFLNTKRNQHYPVISLIADLQTGEWRQFGKSGSAFRSQCRLDGHSSNGFGMHDLLLHYQEKISGYSYVNGRTGDKLGHTPNRSWHPKLLKQGRASKRRNTPLRMPDGRRLWIFDRRIEVETEDGDLTVLPWGPRHVAHGVIGYGFRVFEHPRRGTRRLPSSHDFHTYDWRRGKLYKDRAFAWGCCWVLADGWLIADLEHIPKQPRSGRNVAQRWSLYDPDTGAEQALPWMKGWYRVMALLEGNRVLVDATTRENDLGLQILAIDVVSQRVQRVELPGDLPSLWRDDRGRELRWYLTAGNLWQAPMVSSNGRRVFQLHGGGRQANGYVTLTPGEHAFTPWIPGMGALAFLDEQTLVVIGPKERKVEAVNVLTGERRTLFPR